MDLAFTIVIIALTVIVIARLSAWAGLPAPLTLVTVGAIASYVPWVPTLTLSPEVVLVGLLPPLLYAAALSTSLIDIAENRVPILGLSVGLVLFTAFAVAGVVWWLLPVPFTVAVALGAIVAPPDAVAATAVARRIGLPRRVTTILEGESLLNDATALVTLRTALAAAGLAAHGTSSGAVEEVTAWSVGLDFITASLGGVAIGWLAFLVIGLVRSHIEDSRADTALSFVAPFLAYVPAERVHASGVVSVVTAGLLLAHKAYRLQSASSRLSERVNWASITFLLENTVFLLIGLQVASILDALEASPTSTGWTLLVAVAVLVTVLAVRPLWIVPTIWLYNRRTGTPLEQLLPAAAVSSWAGMRGVVTLAAALTLPDLAYRAELVAIALIVTLGTLLIQGSTLAPLARRLNVHGPDPREDALAEAVVVQAAAAAGLRHIEADPTADPAILEDVREETARRLNRTWERLGTLGPLEVTTPSEARRLLRLEMIAAERDTLIEIRGSGSVDHVVLASVMNRLDAEEASLAWGAPAPTAPAADQIRPEERLAPGCDHLRDEPEYAVPATPEGCPGCLAAGTPWVQLRMCTHCGAVGCCDSTPARHATRHHEETGHPVMRSIEPGEAWRWCYVDEVVG